MSRVTNLWGVRHLMAAFDSVKLDSLRKVLAISLIGTLALTGYNTAHLRDLARSSRVLADENHAILETVEEQTSPEAIARQKAQVEDIIGIIDCNQRQALQDALQGLVDRGILDPSDVVTITRACQQQLDEAATDMTTTTTTIPGSPGAGS